MGYPMTFQRFVKRNALDQGDYTHFGPLKGQWAVGLNLDNPGLGTEEQLIAAQWPYAVKRLREYEARLASLLGDLRRLEKDTTDERSTCAFIASRTGLDPDVVAAVLKEFINW
jgi:hypothetical protein